MVKPASFAKASVPRKTPHNATTNAACIASKQQRIVFRTVSISSRFNAAADLTALRIKLENRSTGATKARFAHRRTRAATSYPTVVLNHALTPHVRRGLLIVLAAERERRGRRSTVDD